MMIVLVFRVFTTGVHRWQQQFVCIRFKPNLEHKLHLRLCCVLDTIRVAARELVVLHIGSNLGLKFGRERPTGSDRFW